MMIGARREPERLFGLLFAFLLRPVFIGEGDVLAPGRPVFRKPGRQQPQRNFATKSGEGGK